MKTEVKRMAIQKGLTPDHLRALRDEHADPVRTFQVEDGPVISMLELCEWAIKGLETVQPEELPRKLIQDLAIETVNDHGHGLVAVLLEDPAARFSGANLVALLEIFAGKLSRMNNKS